MYRHISIFTLEDKSKIQDLVLMLKEVGTCPLIVKNHVGVNLTKLPEGEKGPEFGDVIQTIDFNSKEDLDKYPASKEHLKLFHEGPEMKKVSAIDFEV